MARSRFEMPSAGELARVTFPTVERGPLTNGLDVWAIPNPGVPVVSIALVLPVGSVNDPLGMPGLAGVMADLLDEGTSQRDAIGLAQAFANLGAELSVDVGPDVTTLTLTTLTRFMEPALELLSDVVLRPRLREDDLGRVREIRLNRLRQLRSSASAVADRAFLSAVFGEHAYGHGTLGTSDALKRMSIDDVRAFHAAAVRPTGSTLIVAGDVAPEAVRSAAARQLGTWTTLGDAGLPAVAAAPTLNLTDVPPAVLIVDRPGAPQTEVCVGHLGPTRHTDRYHTLVTLNALLGGQFSSRINLNLREARGLTYGARTAFDFKVSSGTFSCETNVQGDATPLVVAEILAEFEAVGGSRPAGDEELERAKSSLTRGYVRQFETSAHLVFAAARLVTFGLPMETFDRFVPDVETVTPADVSSAARAHILPDSATIVVVGDAAGWRDDMSAFGRPVREHRIEF